MQSLVLESATCATLLIAAVALVLWALRIKTAAGSMGIASTQAALKAPSIFTALQEQLGLKLEPARATIYGRSRQRGETGRELRFSHS